MTSGGPSADLHTFCYDGGAHTRRLWRLSKHDSFDHNVVIADDDQYHDHERGCHHNDYRLPDADNRGHSPGNSRSGCTCVLSERDLHQ